jgi:hypothetical protein
MPTLRQHLRGEMSGNSFLSRILGRDTDEEEARIDWAETFGMRGARTRIEPEVEGQPWEMAVKLAVETIDDLPSNFPRDSAVRIVKRTLAAGGIDIGYFNKRTWARIPQISSEMELARSREKEFHEKTEETIRSLEGEIRKAREAYEAVRAKEEEEITHGLKELENIKRVRAFFGFSELEGEKSIGLSDTETQVRGPLYAGSVQQGRGFFSSTEVEGQQKTGPIGEKAQVGDSRGAAWAQIEAARAQIRGHLDPDTGVDKPTPDPGERPSRYSEHHSIRE